MGNSRTLPLIFLSLSLALPPAPAANFTGHLAPHSAIAAARPDQKEKLKRGVELLRVAVACAKELEPHREFAPFKPLFKSLALLLNSEALESIRDKMHSCLDSGKSLPRDFRVTLPRPISLFQFEQSGRRLIKKGIVKPQPPSLSPLEQTNKIIFDLEALLADAEKEAVLRNSYLGIEDKLLDAYFSEEHSEEHPVENPVLVGPKEEALSRLLLFFPSRFFSTKESLLCWIRILSLPRNSFHHDVRFTGSQKWAEAIVWDIRVRQNILRALARHRPGWFQETVAWLGEPGQEREEALSFFKKTGWVDRKADGPVSAEMLRAEIPIIRKDISPWKQELFMRIKRLGLRHAGENNRLAEYLWNLTFDSFYKSLRHYRIEEESRYLRQLPLMAFLDHAFPIILSVLREKKLRDPIGTVRLFFEIFVFQQSLDTVSLPKEEKRVELWDMMFSLLHSAFPTEDFWFHEFWNLIDQRLNRASPQMRKERAFKAKMGAAFNDYMRRGTYSASDEDLEAIIRANPSFQNIENWVRGLQATETSL